MLGAGWHNLPVIEMLEKDLKTTVVSSIPAQVWATKKILHLNEPRARLRAAAGGDAMKYSLRFKVSGLAFGFDRARSAAAFDLYGALLVAIAAAQDERSVRRRKAS